MGRSVSYPSDAIVVFQHREEQDGSCQACDKPFFEFELVKETDGSWSRQVCCHCGSDDLQYEDRYANFQEDVGYLRSRIMESFPSAEVCDRFIGREDHAVLKNKWAYFGVSEYCGCVAVWMTPRDESEINGWTQISNHEALRDHWIQSAEKKFREAVSGTMGQDIELVARMSNGEAVFRAAA